ncbi:MAG: response regulator [Methanoregulaceae archaeon]|nr:response regulator [Methanoregulaceae archaeon]
MMKTIMVVDDNAAIVDIFITMLRHKGYGTIAAYSGEEAIRALEKAVPDLIFLDILMEPLDGWETLERIKAHPHGKKIPVMMLTAKNPGPDEVHKHSSDIDDYIMKPITRRQLYEIVEQFFERNASIEDQARKASNVGFDPALVDEYRTLSREIDIRKRLCRLLDAISGAGDPSGPVRKDVIEVLEKMNAEIKKREQRVKAINMEFAVEGETLQS